MNTITLPQFLMNEMVGTVPMSEPSSELPASRSRSVTTYSEWSSFRNCRKACELRYERMLVPVGGRDAGVSTDEGEGEGEPGEQQAPITPRALNFGDIIHEAGLRTWHTTSDLGTVLDRIDRAYAVLPVSAQNRRDRLVARAMMTGYADRWKYDATQYEVVFLERTFTGEIRNPATGVVSRSFTIAGKIDGIFRDVHGKFWLLEHKTAAVVDRDYLEKLWTDFQISIYAHYVKEAFGIVVSGVLYNILGKTKINPKLGETEAEFEARSAVLAAKNKSGKTTAKRTIGETDAEFEARLKEWYARPEAFHREELYLSKTRTAALLNELWELTQARLEARRRGAFYQNPGWMGKNCSSCSYKPICRSDENPNVIANLYRKEDPHTELRERESASTFAV